MKKLSSYLSAGIAATATFQSSDAATVVTLYGPGAQTTPATPAGIDIGLDKTTYGFIDRYSSTGNSFFAIQFGTYFTTGNSFKVINAAGSAGNYSIGKAFVSGAQSGSENYANISFNGNDGVYEAVGQFNLTGVGTGYLVALAINDDNSALSISAGKAAIDAVPEPSAIALLSLGAGAVMLRRRRKVA